MEIFISLLAVVAATGCFAAILAADWSERRKHRLAWVTAKRSDSTSNQQPTLKNPVSLAVAVGSFWQLWSLQ